ncbi:uncharacterized protein LOC129674984 [Psammomys obesus]|uniref:uncharacterized protein LOC129674984 n=1 Tax=Psammomys obesus TaxID=48139 RepID=UPI002453530A|nr:uncharacterized protein LOC129674984 [Psammomys obesus]
MGGVEVSHSGTVTEFSLSEHSEPGTRLREKLTRPPEAVEGGPGRAAGDAEGGAGGARLACEPAERQERFRARASSPSSQEGPVSRRAESALRRGAEPPQASGRRPLRTRWATRSLLPAALSPVGLLGMSRVFRNAGFYTSVTFYWAMEAQRALEGVRLQVLFTHLLAPGFCMVYSHRAAREGDEEKSTGGKKSYKDNESQEGFFWLRWPLWLRDMYRPLHDTRKKNMAQDLQDKESSGEEEIFNKDVSGETTKEEDMVSPSQRPTEADESETADDAEGTEGTE